MTSPTGRSAGKMRVLLAAPGFSKSLIEARLREIAEIDLAIPETDEETSRVLPETDVLIVAGRLFSSAMSDAVTASEGRVKWIQLLNAGYDRIPLDRIRPSIVVSNAGLALAVAVADHAMALLLSIARRLPQAGEAQRSEQWLTSVKDGVISLYGKTVVIVGFGPVGQEIARRARGFGARIVAISRRGIPDPLAEEVYPASGLDEVLGRADAIISAVPFNAGSDRMFDAARFARCPPGLLFVNVGRGNTVDLDALQEALREGKLAAAALDVVDPEPLPPGHLLWSTPNLVITPHMGGGGAYGRLASLVGENVERFCAGKPPLSIVQR